MKQIQSERDFFESDVRIKQAMTRMPYTVAPHVPAQQAREIMRAFKVRHLPVLEGGSLAGVVKDADIQFAVKCREDEELAVRHVMRRDPYVVGPEAYLGDVIGEMIDGSLSSAIVVSPEGLVIGIFTATDAHRLLHSLLLLGRREKEAAALYGAGRPPSIAQAA